MRDRMGTLARTRQFRFRGLIDSPDGCGTADPLDVEARMDDPAVRRNVL
jgi:hypothetical protein